MKTKKVLALVLCGTLIFSNMATSYVYADTQTEAAVNTEYPLQGMLPELHLELVTVNNDVYSGTAFKEGYWNDNTTEYGIYNNSFADLSDYNWMTNHVARLSGQNEYYVYFGQDQAKENAEYEVIKNFLNSFDWRNASDVEKVSKVLSLLKEASYDYEADETSFTGDSFEAYGCLVNKKAVCDGYSKAFVILTRLMNMKGSKVIVNGHAFNAIEIDGIWYYFDGTKLPNTENVMTLYKTDISTTNNIIFINNLSKNEYIAINF